MYPFIDAQMEFPGPLSGHNMNGNLPIGLDAEGLSSLSASRCWPPLNNQQASSG